MGKEYLGLLNGDEMSKLSDMKVEENKTLLHIVQHEKSELAILAATDLCTTKLNDGILKSFIDQNKQSTNLKKIQEYTTECQRQNRHVTYLEDIKKVWTATDRKLKAYSLLKLYIEEHPQKDLKTITGEEVLVYMATYKRGGENSLVKLPQRCELPDGWENLEMVAVVKLLKKSCDE